MRRLLTVFTRWPEPGCAKTRLAPSLGAGGAAAVSRAMTEHTLRRIAGACATVEIRYTGGDEERLRAWLGRDLRYRPQGEGDLGTRLRGAFEAGFAEGAESVAAVGTDCPDLDAGLVDEAFAELRVADVVFGPAADGGYYLVGVRRAAWAAAAQLFTGIPWGGAGVLDASARAARAAGLELRLLRSLADVDRPEDLAHWERARAAAALLSVVIPARDEEAWIGRRLEELRREENLEVIVADGGSGDRTREIASDGGALLVSGRAGRAAQMNAGAAAARGGVLLFLHADTRLAPGFADLVRRALEDPRTVGGAFRFATDSRRRSLRLVERVARWRARRLGVILGDQAIFVRRRDFDAIGGFPDQPILEDGELVRRLRRRGRLALLEAEAVTSARRWEAHGVWRTSAANGFVLAAWSLGAPAAALARWYRRLLGKGRAIV